MAPGHTSRKLLLKRIFGDAGGAGDGTTAAADGSGGGDGGDDAADGAVDDVTGGDDAADAGHDSDGDDVDATAPPTKLPRTAGDEAGGSAAADGDATVECVDTGAGGAGAGAGAGAGGAAAGASDKARPAGRKTDARTEKIRADMEKARYVRLPTESWLRLKDEYGLS